MYSSRIPNKIICWIKLIIWNVSAVWIKLELLQLVGLYFAWIMILLKVLEELLLPLMVGKFISSVVRWIIAEELPGTLHCKCSIYFVLQACQILWYEAVASCCTLPVKTKILPVQEVIFWWHEGGRVNFPVLSPVMQKTLLPTVLCKNILPNVP